MIGAIAGLFQGAASKPYDFTSDDGKQLAGTRYFITLFDKDASSPEYSSRSFSVTEKVFELMGFNNPTKIQELQGRSVQVQGTFEFWPRYQQNKDGTYRRASSCMDFKPTGISLTKVKE